MTRTIVLTFSSLVALGVGALALGWPRVLLAGKGVAPTPATVVWVREVGVLIGALGVLGLMVRAHPDSPTMQAVLAMNALVQLGMLPLEWVAYRQGIITRLAGVVPNTVLHATLALAFALLWWG